MSNPTKMMNSWKITFGDPVLRRRQVIVPEPRSDEVLVRLLAMGVCHSDCAIQNAYFALPPTWAEEFTIGHEGAGVVVSDDASGLFCRGDRVSIHSNPGCRQCPTCELGYERACTAVGNGGYGLGRDGFFQEYTAARVDALVKIPDNVRIEDAAVVPDAILTAYHAVKHAAEVKAGQTVAIFGMGGLGLNGLQVAKHLGAKRIMVVDKLQEALDLAIKLGVAAEDAICTGPVEARPFHEIVAERGILVDTVIDFVGHEETILSSQLSARAGGTIVQVGLLSPQGPLIPMVMTTKVLTIKGTYAGTVQGLKECLDLVSRGVIRPELSTASIEQLPQVLKDLDDGKIRGRKVLLPDWDDA